MKGTADRGERSQRSPQGSSEQNPLEFQENHLLGSGIKLSGWFARCEGQTWAALGGEASCRGEPTPVSSILGHLGKAEVRSALGETWVRQRPGPPPGRQASQWAGRGLQESPVSVRFTGVFEGLRP